LSKEKGKKEAKKERELVIRANTETVHVKVLYAPEGYRFKVKKWGEK